MSGPSHTFDPEDEAFDYWIEAYRSGFSSIDLVAFNLGITQAEVQRFAFPGEDLVSPEERDPPVDIELRRKLDRMGR
jgi:hypothetical protein